MTVSERDRKVAQVGPSCRASHSNVTQLQQCKCTITKSIKKNESTQIRLCHSNSKFTQTDSYFICPSHLSNASVQHNFGGVCSSDTITAFSKSLFYSVTLVLVTQMFLACGAWMLTLSSVQFSSRWSLCTQKSPYTYTSSCLSKVFPTLPLKQFQCSSDWQLTLSNVPQTYMVACHARKLAAIRKSQLKTL